MCTDFLSTVLTKIGRRNHELREESGAYGDGDYDYDYDYDNDNDNGEDRKSQSTGAG